MRSFNIGTALCLLFLAACSYQTNRNTATPVIPYILQGGGPPLNFSRFSPNTYSGTYGGITAGPDKNMWFIDRYGPGLVKLTMTGTTTEYPLPSKFSYELFPIAIAPAPGGRFYVLDCDSNSNDGALEVVTTSGKVKVYPLPSGSLTGSCQNPETMTEGPDGNAWITGYNDIFRVTTTGVIQQIPYLAGPNATAYIVNGPGGLLWFTDRPDQSIDSVSTTGTITAYPFGGLATNLLAPIDGNLWFVCSLSSNCGNASFAQMTPAGVFTYFAAPAQASQIQSAGVGPGGFAYFAFGAFASAQPGLFRVSVPSGKITTIQSPYGSDSFIATSAGPDSNLWSTAETTQGVGHVIVYITKILTVTPTSLNFSSPQLTDTLTAKEKGNPSLSASSSNVGVATVTNGQVQNTFTVTSAGVGSCTITVQDGIGNSFDVPVTVQ